MKFKVAVLKEDDDNEPVLIFQTPVELRVSIELILQVPGADDCVVNLKKSSPSFTCKVVFAPA